MQNTPIKNVKNSGAISIRKTERPADRITTNSDERDSVMNVESPASIITKGIASIIIEGMRKNVFFTPELNPRLFEAIKLS